MFHNSIISECFATKTCKISQVLKLSLAPDIFRRKLRGFVADSYVGADTRWVEWRVRYAHNQRHTADKNQFVRPRRPYSAAVGLQRKKRGTRSSRWASGAVGFDCVKFAVNQRPLQSRSVFLLKKYFSAERKTDFVFIEYSGRNFLKSLPQKNVVIFFQIFD